MGRCHSVKRLAAGLVLLSCLIGGTLAYFYDDVVVSSDVIIRKRELIEVHLTEPLWESDEQGLELLPGDVVPADPTLGNVEDPVYIRIVMTLHDRIDGKRITGARADKILSMLYCSTTRTWINETEYSFDVERSSVAEGYFCFNYIGNEGIMVTGSEAVLFDSVYVPVEWNQTDMELAGSFVIHMQGEAIHAESVQTEGAQTPEQVYELLHETSGITGGMSDE